MDRGDRVSDMPVRVGRTGPREDEVWEMRIAILGAGNVGSAVARAAAKAGHQVVLTAPSGDKARAVATEVGGTAVESNQQAVADADMVVLGVPCGADDQ